MKETTDSETGEERRSPVLGPLTQSTECPGSWRKVFPLLGWFRCLALHVNEWAWAVHSSGPFCAWVMGLWMSFSGVDPPLLDWLLVFTARPLLDPTSALALSFMLCSHHEPGERSWPQKGPAIPLNSSPVQTHPILSCPLGCHWCLRHSNALTPYCPGFYKHAWI